MEKTSIAKIIALAAEKGGVGKTTMGAHTVYALREIKAKVLVIDTCPQSNISSALGVARGEAEESSSVHLFDGKCPEPILTESGAYLLPASRKLERVEAMDQKTAITAFRNAVRRMVADGGFDFCVIDTPPSIGVRLRAALGAATNVVSPMECATFSLEGLDILLDTISEVKALYNPELRHDAIIANKYRGTESHKEVHKTMMAATTATLTTPLGLYSAIEATAQTHKPVWASRKTGAERKAADNMEAVIIEVIGKVQK